ncbi:MAG: universal stress protein [Caldimicrobium sp.]|jgi:nucleotide-binding universal stress UspA family protein
MKIVVAYDGSEDAKEGVRLAKKFLEEEGGELTLLTVVAKREDMSSDEISALRKKAENLMSEAKSLFSDLKLQTEIIEDFSVPEAILKFVEKKEADLLIMGAKGTRPDILRYTLGSTAAKVVTYSPCSVFIVRKKPKEE